MKESSNDSEMVSNQKTRVPDFIRRKKSETADGRQAKHFNNVL